MVLFVNSHVSHIYTGKCYAGIYFRGCQKFAFQKYWTGKEKLRLCGTWSSFSQVFELNYINLKCAHIFALLIIADCLFSPSCTVAVLWHVIVWYCEVSWVFIYLTIFILFVSRDQFTTTEVNMARVYNWDVKRRQAAKASSWS